MTAPRIAVLLAAFNGARFIQEQLASILAQERVEVTVFASIDPSTDGTQELLERLAREDGRLVLLPAAGPFGAAAPNFLRLLRDVEFSGFDHVAYADQDDVWHADKLWRAHTAMLRTGCGGYSSNVTAFWPSGREILIDKAQPQKCWDHLFEAAGPGCTYVLSCPLAAALQQRVRELRLELEALGYHDWLTYAFAREAGFGWTIDRHPGMRYRQHARNQLGANTGPATVWRRALKILSGHGFTQARLVAQAAGAGSAAPLRLMNSGRVGMMRLAFMARKCRRRPRDQFLFALAGLCSALDPRGRGL